MVSEVSIANAVESISDSAALSGAGTGPWIAKRSSFFSGHSLTQTKRTHWKQHLKTGTGCACAQLSEMDSTPLALLTSLTMTENNAARSAIPSSGASAGRGPRLRSGDRRRRAARDLSAPAIRSNGASRAALSAIAAALYARGGPARSADRARYRRRAGL